MAFTTLVMFQMFAVLSSRSLQPSWEKLNPFTNPWLLGGISLAILVQIIVLYWSPLQLVFGTVPIGLWDWLKLLVVASLGFVAMETGKLLVHSAPAATS